MYFKLVDGVKGCTCRFANQQALIWRRVQSTQTSPFYIPL